METKETQSRRERKNNLVPKKQEDKKEKKTQKSIWKILFFILLVVNLAGILFVAVRIVMPRDQAVLNQVQTSKADQKVAQITSSTDEVNQLINSFLKPYQTNELSYKFYISGQQAVLEASYQLFGTKVPLYVYFEPLALPDGRISLSVQSISAGSLNLPTSAVLDMVRSYQLPDFIQVDSKTNQIVINLPKLKLADSLYLKVNQIDLSKGNFIFDLMKKA